MPLKVRCPKCRTEIADPPDLRAVTCPCGALFDGRNAPLGYWIGAGILCALVLVALWITAWQNRDRKLAARYGEPAPTTSPTGRPLLNLATERRDAAIDEYFARTAKLHPGGFADVEVPPDVPFDLQKRVLQAAQRRGVIPRFFMGEPKRLSLRLERQQVVHVEHFRLWRMWGSVELAVQNAQGSNLVQYELLEPGDVRRWHELEIRCRTKSEAELVLDLELKPGSPCYGPGTYALRPGLRVDLPDDRSVLVTSHDADTRIEVTLGAQKIPVMLDGPAPIGSVHLSPWPLVGYERGLKIVVR